VRALVDPIANDLDLDVYDVEQRGGTLRVTLDTRPGSAASVDLEQLSLATRLISRELDHADPVPGRYTLEVTSPGVERSLRTPAHFQREVGKTVSIRLANVEAEQRRLEGVLVAADDRTATIRVEAGGDSVDQVIDIDSIDRARTVFVWGPQPKPGKPGSRKHAASVKGIRQSVPDQPVPDHSAPDHPAEERS
jgi:ribosome maturation factor RimP